MSNQGSSGVMKTHLPSVYIAAIGTIDREHHFHRSEEVSMSPSGSAGSATYCG